MLLLANDDPEEDANCELRAPAERATRRLYALCSGSSKCFKRALMAPTFRPNEDASASFGFPRFDQSFRSSSSVHAAFLDMIVAGRWRYRCKQCQDARLNGVHQLNFDSDAVTVLYFIDLFLISICDNSPCAPVRFRDRATLLLY